MFKQISKTTFAFFPKAFRLKKLSPMQIPINFKQRFQFSTAQQVERAVLMSNGSLMIRNSETWEIKLVQLDIESHKSQQVAVYFDAHCTLEEVAKLFEVQFNTSNAQILCDQNLPILKETPVAALINRFFYIQSKDYLIMIQGEQLQSSQQLTRSKGESQIIQNVKHLQLPIIIAKELDAYLSRVNLWVESKQGKVMLDEQLKMSTQQVKQILVEALMNPLRRNSELLALQKDWEKIYWQVQELKDKQQEAIKICHQMVKRRLSIGALLIASNITFIWSGTYYFFSWDIIEPIAYFISSFAGIALTATFLTIQRPFSLENFKDFLIDRYMPYASLHVKYDPNQLKEKQQALKLLESALKDSFLIQL